MMAAIGILIAYIWARETGEGQYVDVALLDGVFSWLHGHAEEYFVTRQAPVRGRTLLSGKYACYGVYEAKDNKYVAIGCLEANFWGNLCAALGLEQYVQWQFDEDKQEEIRAKLAQIFKARTRDEWVADLSSKDICIGPVNTLVEAATDPQLVYRNMLCEFSHPTLGPIAQIANPIKMPGFPEAHDIRMPPPRLGQHTDLVLESLGYTTEQIAQLRSEDAV